MFGMHNNLKIKGLKALAQNRFAWHWALNPKSRSGRDNEAVQPSGMGNNAR